MTPPGALAVCLALSVPLLAGCLGGEDAGAGRAAPDFTLTTMDGSEVRLDDYRGRVLVIDMMATWCGPCKEAMPAFREYLAAHEGAPVDVLSVSVDPSERTGGDDPLPGFMAKYNATWPAAYDTDDVFAKYRAHGIPTLVVIDHEGRVREKLQPASLTVDDLERIVTPIVQEARDA